MDFPEFHRSYSRTPLRETKPALKPGGVPRQGELVFRTLNAHLLQGSKLGQITVFEKPNQNFWAYATAFEKTWSKAASLQNVLDPVVDGNLMVVGHTGRIDTGSIIVPKKLPYDKDSKLLGVLLKAGIPFFVAKQPPDSMWEPYLRASYTEGGAVTVVTGIDGRVVQAGDVRPTGSGAIAEAFSPMDAVMIVHGVASIGAAAGKFLVRGLAGKAAAGGAGAVLFSGATKELANLASSGPAAQIMRRSTQYIRESGLTASHFSAFQAAAKETQYIAVVRNTKTASTKLIEAGCPGKPMFFKFHTSESTGVLTARTPDEVAQAWAREYFVVGADGIARREVIRQGKRVTETLDIKTAFWKVEKGQVIDPVIKKPLVGDYDLMGVIDPSAAGRNIALAAKEGSQVQDVISPAVKKFAEKVNGKLDRPRVLHGAQDQFGGFSGGATAFHPDGTVTFLPNEAAVKQFYETLGRQTRTGSYASPGGAKPPVDELAARRAARK